MIYRIYPSKDTTIYEDSTRKNQNTGKDEILEIGKFYDTDNTSLLGNSRALIEFDLTSISQSIVSGDITSPQYRLRAENIENREIQSSYDLYVFPLKESWSEGLGSEADTPHNTLDSTWVSRSLSSIWDVTNSTVGKPITPGLLAGLEVYYNFAANVGGFELIEPIKGTGGESPLLEVSGGKLILSSSNYGGGTATLSSSLEQDKVYTIEFDFNKGTLSGVDFRVYKPDGSYLDDSEMTNYTETLSTAGTYKMVFTASDAGTYKPQFTFFDNNGANGSSGNVDNFYIYSLVDDNTLIFDQFNIDGDVPSTYFLNEHIRDVSLGLQTMKVSNFKLEMSASDFSGATLNRGYLLQENKSYTASFGIDPGNLPNEYADGSKLGIEFKIQEPDGRVLDSSEIIGYEKNITSSKSIEVEFTSAQDGEYLFQWSFFGSGSGEFSASLDDFKLQSSDVDTTSSLYNDIYYDANWVKNQGGGTWFTSSFNTGKHYYQSFDKYTSNLDVEVTDYVDEWLDGTRSNNGLIIKKYKVDEQSTKKFGSIKFFSSDTHTIYPPVLEARWDDTVFETGSLDALSSDDMVVYVKNLSTEYKETSKGKIRVYGRDRFPARTFSSTSNYTLVKYLPTTSYYSVVDADTEQVIIPFDTNYTKIGCDSEGNYFNFWFNGLQPERFYKFVFRIDQNGTTKYFDDNFYFKVVR